MFESFFYDLTTLNDTVRTGWFVKKEKKKMSQIYTIGTLGIVKLPKVETPSHIIIVCYTSF